MTNNIEYSFYDDSCTTTVNREKQSLTMYERGGWSQSYTLTFKELLEYANNWEIAINLQEPDEIIAKIGTNIILANNAVEHNLDPFRYVPKTHNLTDPRDKNILVQFESLFKKYDSTHILAAMSEAQKEILKNHFLKI
jgi:hypothetical protein